MKRIRTLPALLCFAPASVIGLIAIAAPEPMAPMTATPATQPTPLFTKETKLEPATVEDTPKALISRSGDRGRDRHAREWMFHAYDHYLALYWIDRTDTIEVVDTVAKGGDTVTFNMTSLVPLHGPNLRAFFEGKGTVAQYSDNMTSKQSDPQDRYHYTISVKYNTNTHAPIKIGDRIEIEFSPFIEPNFDGKKFEGRTNYYGTALLYVVGKPGFQPWEWHTPVAEAQQKKGAAIDSYPLPDEALLGGRTSISEQYSDEPKARFQQMALNVAPTDSQPFMLGRRLHHTNFDTGNHSEPGNPVFKEQAGKLGTDYANVSCISCHDNNGRALPAAANAPMNKYAVHVGIDAEGTPHPILGCTLQGNSSTKKPEGTCVVSSWTTTSATYADGTAYSLQKPSYKFTGPVPAYFSVRLAPQLVGMGLLEAVDEKTIADLAAAKKTAPIAGHMQMLTDPVDGKLRMGRFGVKAGQATLKYQIASAFDNDMGITTSIYPMPDHGSAGPAPAPSEKMDAKDLDNLYRYVALLGVPPRRNFRDEAVIKGEKLFASANCIECHTQTLTTSPYHPLTELRSQTIHPYTDMLLHDMGKGLADNMGEGKASGSDWRTPPLWGIGLTAGVSGGEAYLHDGRARTLSEAILWHGGEAEKAKENFRTMTAEDRDALIAFLKSL